MAQTEFVTDEGIEELVKLWAEIAATGMEYIVGLNDSTPCTAAVTDTYAAPADPHHTDGGLAEQAITTVSTTTVSTTGDTITFDHVLTATATRNLSGVAVLNNEAGTPNVTFISCCFNAVLAMENTDTCTIDGQCQINQA